MLRYAVKLTKTPWKMQAQDVEKLRRSGFSDAAILDINQIAGYYNFVNRLADGLGVELEHYWGITVARRAGEESGDSSSLRPSE
jgi:alkylhydroperoxidase family enzyme